MLLQGPWPTIVFEYKLSSFFDNECDQLRHHQSQIDPRLITVEEKERWVASLPNGNQADGSGGMSILF